VNSIESVINFLCERRLHLATAESCTAGMVTSLLADMPGCGSVLEIGYVVYTEHAKHSCLGVNFETMKSFGLTSEEVAQEMAVGALARSSTDLTLAVTGTAESDDELNGVICFAYAIRTQENFNFLSETIKFYGDRNSVRKSAAIHAIMSIPMFYEKLINNEGEIFK
jgi:nicotinamide-nucleotide amidase